MDSRNDSQLLRDYAERRSETAFAELVRRHVDLVHSAALRMVCDSHLAQDVTQGAFIALARSAPQLTERAVLSGWLHRTAQNIAAQTVRTDVRRRAREQEAAAMNELLAHESDASWEHIAPHLDAALGELSESDRDALMLRYFERKSAHEMAQTLGISDEAAQKRVNRAVERLREFFAKRGVTVGASGLVVVISANAVQAAPVGLAVAISTAAVLAGTTIVTTTTATATKAIAMTATQKSLIAAALVAAIGVGIYEARQASTLRAQLEALEQQQRPFAEQIEQVSRERDDLTRRLAAQSSESQTLQANAAELLRLRGEVARLRASAQAASQMSGTTDTNVTAAQSWLNRAQLLRARLEQMPEAKIPELLLASEDDWLNASKGKLETEIDYRKALSHLRSAVENKVVLKLHAALKKFQENSNGQFPTAISQLEAYFEPPIDPSMLGRWKIVPARELSSLGMGGDSIITQSPVDKLFDQRWGLGPNGFGTTSFGEQDGPLKTMLPVLESFFANGQPLIDPAQLMPFATTPSQRTMLEQLATAFKTMSPEVQAETLKQIQGATKE